MVKRKQKFYNLDVIISVGYRVKSKRGTQFRQWANKVLKMLSKRNQGVTAKIYTAKITPQLQLDLEKHNDQYPPINIMIYKGSHDRFPIIDQRNVYHIGASLKDLGKKMFAFSKMDIPAEVITERL